MDPSTLARDRSSPALGPSPAKSSRQSLSASSRSETSSAEATSLPYASDALSQYGDVSGRISELQRQNMQAQAVLDANAQQQVCFAAARVCGARKCLIVFVCGVGGVV